jgi:hypothetical protein
VTTTRALAWLELNSEHSKTSDLRYSARDSMVGRAAAGGWAIRLRSNLGIASVTSKAQDRHADPPAAFVLTFQQSRQGRLDLRDTLHGKRKPRARLWLRRPRTAWLRFDMWTRAVVGERRPLAPERGVGKANQKEGLASSRPPTPRSSQTTPSTPATPRNTPSGASRCACESPDSG